MEFAVGGLGCESWVVATAPTRPETTSPLHAPSGRLDPEEDLVEFDELGVLSTDFHDRARAFRRDVVENLHRLDLADDRIG